MQYDRRSFKFIHELGILIFPIFFILDCVIYPDHKWLLLEIRVFVVIYLFIALLLINKVKDRYAVMITRATFIVVAFAISIMCFVTGDGMSSPFYAGILLVMAAFSVLVYMELKWYISTISIIIVIHFSLLLFSSWDFRSLMTNIVFLGSFAFMGSLIHHRMYLFLKEIKTLEGFLPICAKCKNIRDDKGFWYRVEEYIRDHSEAEFTHSLCPECAKELKREIDNLEETS